jgi:hypothetical protein
MRSMFSPSPSSFNHFRSWQPDCGADVFFSSFRSRKYYFVQISTGESQWDIPTEPAPQVPTPGGTPAQSDPYPAPSPGTRGMDGQEGDRGLGVSSFLLDTAHVWVGLGWRGLTQRVYRALLSTPFSAASRVVRRASSLQDLVDWRRSSFPVAAAAVMAARAVDSSRVLV